MPTIKQLIQQLCPDGVEYKKLGEVCEFKRGSSLVSKDAVAGDIPVISGGQSPAFYHNIPNRKENTITVAGSGAYAGFVSFWTIPIFAADCFTVEPCENLSRKYTYYFLKNKQQQIYSRKKGAGVPHVHGKDIATLSIPVPPIAIQERIVEVLDKFTTLEAELEAELEARRKQYAYYREKLLSFPQSPSPASEIEWKTINDICLSICSGGTPSTNKKEYYSGNIPWLRTQEVDWNYINDTEIKISEEGLRNSSAKLIPANCLIIAMYGATAAKVAINKIPLTTNQACCNLKIDEHVCLTKFVYQWFCANYENLKAMGEGSQHNINAKKIKNYAIPVPPLAEQERIVGILDRFEALVNDLSQGLPAELKARRQQYEYYRDKLLTFKEKA